MTTQTFSSITAAICFAKSTGCAATTLAAENATSSQINGDAKEKPDFIAKRKHRNNWQN